MEKKFYGEYGEARVVKESKEEFLRTEYTRITKENVEFKLVFLQTNECDTIQLMTKIVDIDGTKWHCCIMIIKSKNYVKCSARLGSVCNMDYTDISLEDYNKILNAFTKATDPNKPFRIRQDLISILYGTESLQLQEFVETFGFYLGFVQLLPKEECLVRKQNLVK